jgi:hypothetical protein
MNVKDIEKINGLIQEMKIIKKTIDRLGGETRYHMQAKGHQIKIIRHVSGDQQFEHNVASENRGLKLKIMQLIMDHEVAKLSKIVEKIESMGVDVLEG